MTEPAKRPGYPTAEDQREFVQVSLAGWRFERRMRKPPGEWRRELHWFITGPCKNYDNGPWSSRRAAVTYVLTLLEEKQDA